MLQRKTDEASVLQKRLYHLALESESGRDKAQAYASSLTPGGSKPRPPGGYRTPTPGGSKPCTPGGNRTPGKGQRATGLTTSNCQASSPAGVTPRVSTAGGRFYHRQLADVQVGNLQLVLKLFLEME